MNSIAVAGGLSGRYLPRADLDEALRRSMFVLLRSHFTGVDRETFEADLAGKNWVVLLEDERGVLRGFSTLLIRTQALADRSGIVVYSGDTIVAREWWGSPALPMTWLRAVRGIVPASGDLDIYWLLLTSGFRTYRFLPVFFREYVPRADGGGGEAAQALLGDLAAAQFGDHFDRRTGIVRFARPQVLAPELLDVPPGRARDPHVRYFLERNPGYVRGDELACLTRLANDNLTPAGVRIARAVQGSDLVFCRNDP